MGNGYFDRLNEIRPRSGPCRGSPTTRARTISWASSSAPTPRTTTAAGARRSSTPRSPTPARPRTRTTSARRSTVREEIVQRDVPVVPVSYGDGLGAVRGPIARSGPERAWRGPHGGARMGRLNASVRRALAPLFGALLLAAVVAPSALGADLGVTFGKPEATLEVRGTDRIRPAGALDRPSTGPSCA